MFSFVINIVHFDLNDFKLQFEYVVNAAPNTKVSQVILSRISKQVTRMLLIPSLYPILHTAFNVIGTLELHFIYNAKHRCHSNYVLDV